MHVFVAKKIIIEETSTRFFVNERNFLAQDLTIKGVYFQVLEREKTKVDTKMPDIWIPCIPANINPVSDFKFKNCSFADGKWLVLT